ncbi:MAG: TM0106 family RecB-like putative nuclease [Myxococcota bacterium]
MRSRGDGLELSATDVSHFLACRHRTGLELAAAAGKLRRPRFDDPQLEALFARGLTFEREYVASLAADGKRLVDLADARSPDAAVAQTLAAMREGADWIVQAALSHESWQGRPDVLVKVPKPSALGDWSYEVEDTKLARETRAGAILQLGLYCEMLEVAQGMRPEAFHIVTPHGRHSFRVEEYAAYFRWVRDGLEATSREDPAALIAASYPEPCDHCDVCPWSSRCSERRRADDHLSLVAGISRAQRRELEEHGIATLRALAKLALPLPFKPKRAAPESFERVHQQARLQLESREQPIAFELLDVVAEQGLCLLPEPTPDDVFLDLEGAPFAGELGSGGREYLFGIVTLGAAGEPTYRALWADSTAAEKLAFEELVDLIQGKREASPGMHVFHYAPYEPSALKRLMCRHATRENEIDALLRSGAFVDLYAIVRQALRAGVERYSIKNLEPLYAYTREVELSDARRHLQAMELALELDGLAELAPAVREAVAGYNRDDCVSALRLRDWLETLRARERARGSDIPRPELQPGEPSEELDARQQRVAALRARLLEPDEPSQTLLAYLLDFHRREEKSGWWEYFRLRDLPEEDLLEERAAVAGLAFVAQVGRIKQSAVMRFSYPPQELELRRKDSLKLRDEKSWGEVVAVDRAKRTIDVKVGPTKTNLQPSSAFKHKQVSQRVIEDALFAIGEGIAGGGADPLAEALLYARPPKSRDVTELHETVLAIQGPPGSGKTYTGGTMICDLVRARKKVGVIATSHKVIQNLLRAVAHEADKRGMEVRLAHKHDPDEDEDEDGDDARSPRVRFVDGNAAALALLTSGQTDVLGGTTWLWARAELRKQVDVLFIDEAGQMSLANALAVTQAANSLVLLGDPQQLDQPQKGVHPDGVNVSALEHLLGEHKTMPEERGLFLPETRRFGSTICAFTSEVFYEGRLAPAREIGLERQRLSGGPIDGAGLFVIDVEHDGNRNASDEEVEAVSRIVERLLAPGSRWIDAAGVSARVEPADILVVAPYNAQVSRLAETLRAGVEVGTVDRFQGRQAPVVLYSMATSRPELAPRGMEFLYSLNRLNVATSRAQCAAIVVASPRLFEPECKSPRQMRLASALCRLRELATLLPTPS